VSGIDVETARFSWETSRLTWDGLRCHVIVDIPGQGRYRARAAAYRLWRARGVEACVGRVAEVNEGYTDSPPAWLWRCFDKRVLAVMCGDWEGHDD
jgi:hypothetical protein